METTLNKIREHSPCTDGWEKLLKHLGKTKADDEPLPILIILESNGLDDALWALRAVDGRDDDIRRLACQFALSVAHLWEMPAVVREYLETQDGSKRAAAWAARAAAWAAADAADAADAAAWAAADAAGDAGDAAWAAADAAARAAAWAAAWAAARQEQTEMLREACRP